MKIAIIGGGSTYTPEIVSGFIKRRDELPLKELWLMDISPKRLEIVGGFARRMVEAAGAPFTVFTTTDMREAVAGSTYVVTQIRVGGSEARREDEYLGLRHGLIGQETTGVGGMAKAMRTIPVVLEIARTMETAAPDALLLNFTNPAGLVTEAVTRYSRVQAVGVCNGPFSIQRNLMDILKRRSNIDPTGQDVYMGVLGINHLSWQYSMTVNGQDVWDTVIETYLEEARAGTNGHIPFDPRTIEVLRMVPSSYLQYFYYTDRKLREQQNWPPSRAEQVMVLEKTLLEEYADPNNSTMPEGLLKRGGAYYSTVATQMINSHYNDLNEIHSANVPHNGAVEGFPADWVLETNCRVSRSGVSAVEAKALPIECAALLSAVKAYELHTVQAAVHGDRDAAYKALLVHPLGPSADRIEAVLEDMLAINRAHLPQFEGQMQR